MLNLQEFWLGLSNALMIPSVILGGFWWERSQVFQESLRDQGLVIILPGIEGRSILNRGVAWGLMDAGVPYALEIYDWTTGYRLPLSHLRWKNRNARLAAVIAEKICDYQDEHPGKPVYVIGHSGGGGMAVRILEALPDDHKLTKVILLAPAVAPQHDLRYAITRTEQGIVHYCSLGDVFLLGIGTLVMGTVEGIHSCSAGMVGFAPFNKLQMIDDRGEPLPRLNEIPYQFPMALNWNWGGHFGCVNRIFVKYEIAPHLTESQVTPDS
jgi:pimeloyl-ACP methyl ester carboxylesterase